jgi:hypothetical protein
VPRAACRRRWAGRQVFFAGAGTAAMRPGGTTDQSGPAVLVIAPHPVVRVLPGDHRFLRRERWDAHGSLAGSSSRPSSHPAGEQASHRPPYGLSGQACSAHRGASAARPAPTRVWPRPCTAAPASVGLGCTERRRTVGVSADLETRLADARLRTRGDARRRSWTPTRCSGEFADLRARFGSRPSRSPPAPRSGSARSACRRFT